MQTNLKWNKNTARRKCQMQNTKTCKNNKHAKLPAWNKSACHHFQMSECPTSQNSQNTKTPTYPNAEPRAIPALCFLQGRVFSVFTSSILFSICTVAFCCSNRFRFRLVCCALLFSDLGNPFSTQLSILSSVLDNTRLEENISFANAFCGDFSLLDFSSIWPLQANRCF